MASPLGVILAARKGRQVGLVEGHVFGRRRLGTATQPHLAGSGLRGHSVDDETYPWRVVGVGTAWEVHDVDGQRQGRGCVYYAHAKARAMKRLYPYGYVEQGPNGPRNIGGPLDTIPERLAGLRFTLRWPGAGEYHHFQANVLQDEPGDVLVTCVETGVTHLGAKFLADNQHIALALDLAPFYSDKYEESES